MDAIGADTAVRTFAGWRTRRYAWPGGCFVPRHRHSGGYVSIVLKGHYEEAGDAGRLRLRPGDVVVHQPFEAHLDRMNSAGAEIFNFGLPDPTRIKTQCALTRDPDLIVRLAEKDPMQAWLALLEALQPYERQPADWIDELVTDLIADQRLQLGDWARARQLRPETVSRQFNSVFGVPPCRFRAEARTRLAWRAIIDESWPLAQVAVSCGYTDQAHMTRSISAITGMTPGRWRELERTSPGAGRDGEPPEAQRVPTPRRVR